MNVLRIPVSSPKKIGLILLAVAALTLSGCGGSIPDESSPTPTTTLTGSMTTPRYLHTATLLNNGKVLIVGGFNLDYPGYLNSAEIYDPATGQFKATQGSMKAVRARHSATKLSDGRVLVIGGEDGKKLAVEDFSDEGRYFEALASAEIYDPATDTFTSTGNMSLPRSAHTATLLADGKVLVTGGGGPAENFFYNTVEVFDPSALTLVGTGSFSVNVGPTVSQYPYGQLNTGKMYEQRGAHTATTLVDGKIFISGGTTFGNSEIFNPTTKAISLITSDLNTASTTYRTQTFHHTATLLNSGKVLLAGGDLGYESASVLNGAALFDPAQVTYTATQGSMTSARAWHTATLLNNGKVLITGGSPGSSVSVEIYDPATNLFTAGGTMHIGRSGHTATLLLTGKVLITGGAAVGAGDLAVAELF